MARLARIVIPGLPHHITQRGNRRETVFFSDDDYQAYVSMLAGAVTKAGSEVWAWCLMPNHVHLIVTPSHPDGLRQSVANAHRRYSARINARNKWTGHLWQGRYGSVVMDEPHLLHAIAYISQNPVRAGLVRRAKDWKWSSVNAHLAGKDDALTTVAPVLSRIDDFADFLQQDFDEEAFNTLRRAEIVGRPVGSPEFIKDLEDQTGRQLMPQRPGPKNKGSRKTGPRKNSRAKKKRRR
ncbi:MAG TPA: transposase [Rhizobiales bacterium]|nr:transposase [Hyphomicrobiales bacterium]